MTDPTAFDALMLEVCVEKGWCGSVVDGRSLHVTDFMPDSGEVTADQFAHWLFAADGVDPDEDPGKWQSHLDGLRDVFVRHMGAETADVERLRANGS